MCYIFRVCNHIFVCTSSFRPTTIHPRYAVRLVNNIANIYRSYCTDQKIDDKFLLNARVHILYLLRRSVYIQLNLWFFILLVSRISIAAGNYHIVVYVSSTLYIMHKPTDEVITYRLGRRVYVTYPSEFKYTIIVSEFWSRPGSAFTVGRAHLLLVIEIGRDRDCMLQDRPS